MGRLFAAMVVSLAIIMGLAGPATAAVKATVNGVHITDLQVSQRQRLFGLEGRQATAKAVLDELVDEALIMNEAKRLDIQVTEKQVDDAFLSVARNVRVSVDNLRTVLRQNGVNVDTLRDRLRAAIAWNQITQRAIMPRVQISDAELEEKAAARLDPSREFDYILKEVLFIAPGGKGASQRTAQAEQYRRSFQGCDTAVQLSMSYTDAAVIDVGRRHATQLPDAIAKELSALNVGGMTKPRVVENGVSMLAVCAKAVAEDTTFIKNELRQEVGNTALKAEQDAYLANLRSNARIVYQ